MGWGQADAGLALFMGCWDSAFSSLWSHSPLKEGEHSPSFTHPTVATSDSLHTNTRDPVWKSFSPSSLWLTAAKTASQLTPFLDSPNCLPSITSAALSPAGIHSGPPTYSWSFPSPSLPMNIVTVAESLKKAEPALARGESQEHRAV